MEYQSGVVKGHRPIQLVLDRMIERKQYLSEVNFEACKYESTMLFAYPTADKLCALVGGDHKSE